MTAPLLLLYEFFIIFFRYDQENYTRNAADVWIKYFIQHLGAHGTFAFGVLILAFVAFGFISMVRARVDLNVKYALYAIFESSIYAWLLAFIASWLTSLILVHLRMDEQTQFNLVLALGAGVYEELIFRAIGYGLVPHLLAAIFRLPDLFRRSASDHRRSINRHIGFELKLFAALISSILFAWLHNVNSFSLADYTTLYRFCMGLLFCLLFEIRGLGVTVWTHSLYDVFVFLLA
ncbi:CPBP family intramembrane metalloprotease [candidate division KSB1 bacterium]|nr:CPBP family intramembrane metalloprotease [candidate division KSB1 bacterium]RQW01622.1 MAG: CPBP family intramembrane metalloprotease [candidate division KSB1 bacterium]